MTTEITNLNSLIPQAELPQFNEEVIRSITEFKKDLKAFTNQYGEAYRKSNGREEGPLREFSIKHYGNCPGSLMSTSHHGECFAEMFTYRVLDLEWIGKLVEYRNFFRLDTAFGKLIHEMERHINTNGDRPYIGSGFLGNLSSFVLEGASRTGMEYKYFNSSQWELSWLEKEQEKLGIKNLALEPDVREGKIMTVWDGGFRPVIQYLVGEKDPFINAGKLIDLVVAEIDLAIKAGQSSTLGEIMRKHLSNPNVRNYIASGFAYTQNNIIRELVDQGESRSYYMFYNAHHFSDAIDRFGEDGINLKVRPDKLKKLLLGT